MGNKESKRDIVCLSSKDKETKIITNTKSSLSSNNYIVNSHTNNINNKSSTISHSNIFNKVISQEISYRETKLLRHHNGISLIKDTKLAHLLT
jgi:hypothetical protein